MTREEILRGVRVCLAKVVDRDVDSIREGDKIIDDLGADSLDLLDLIFQLEQHFGIRIKTRDLERRRRPSWARRPWRSTESTPPPPSRVCGARCPRFRARNWRPVCARPSCPTASAWRRLPTSSNGSLGRVRMSSAQTALVTGGSGALGRRSSGACGGTASPAPSPSETAKTARASLRRRRVPSHSART